MTQTNPPAQASDEQANFDRQLSTAMPKQLAIWRAEVARLNDLIAHASGVQASDEPMRVAKGYRIPVPQNTQQAEGMMKLGLAWLKHNAPERLTEAGRAVTPHAIVDVERNAERYLFMRDEATGNFLRFVPYGKPEEIDRSIDAAIAATKGAKP